jgi:hypothetical protein
MSKSKIVRATAEVKLVPNKKVPGQNHGFQTCRLVDADGGYQSFEQYFDPSKASFALEPGDYLVQASEPKIVKDRFVIYPDFVPVAKAQGQKAA